LAVETQDSVLAESIVTPFLRDWPPLTTDSAGSRTAVMAEYMHATGNWDEAIRLYHEARKARTVYPKYHLRWVGMAHDAAGRPDSAIVWLERYIAQPDPDAHPTGNYLPRVHRRLGEIYEDRGDVERAVSHYSAFINFWRNADAVLQPEVEEVRRRVERLTGESG